MKKRLLLVLFLALACAAAAFGCKKGGGNSSSDTDGESVAEVNIVDSAVTLDCFESYSLAVETHGLNIVTWSSSDPTVVAVDENGNITAGIKLGTATITARAGEYSDDCAVTVLLKSGIPEMKSATKAFVSAGGSYDIAFSVFYNSIDISEHLTFGCNAVKDNASAVATASVNGNVVTFGGVAEGETDFTVYTTVFDRLYAENINIVVRNTDVVYVVNGAVNNRLQLRADNERYTSDVEVYYKNERVSDDLLEWTVSDEKVATIGENGKLIMNVEGVAVLSTEYLGKEISVEIQVIKEREFVTVEQTAPLDVDLDLTITVEKLGNSEGNRTYAVNQTQNGVFGLCETNEEGFVVRAFINGEALSVDGSSFSGGTVTLPTKAFGTDNYGEKTLTIEVEYAEVVRVYTLKALLITKIPRTLTDFQTAVVARWLGDRILGYFALESDIDFNLYEISVWATDWNYDNGFRGTLDGRGFSLLNMRSVTYGITAQTGDGAVFKNLKIPNLRYDGGETALFTRGAAGVTFDNIEITLSDDSSCAPSSNLTSCGLLVSHVMKNCKFKNITIYARGKDLQRVFGGKNEDRNTSVYENIVIYANSVTYYENDITVAPNGVTLITE